jgi:putative membrane protein
MMRGQWFGWGDGLWAICGLLLLIAVIVLLVWAVNQLSRSGRADAGAPPEATRPAANEILRERFARGEITEEQFEAAKKVLDRNR